MQEQGGGSVCMRSPKPWAGCEAPNGHMDQGTYLVSICAQQVYNIEQYYLVQCTVELKQCTIEAGISRMVSQALCCHLLYH